MCSFVICPIALPEIHHRQTNNIVSLGERKKKEDVFFSPPMLDVYLAT